MDPKAVEQHRKEIASLIRELYGKRVPKMLRPLLRRPSKPAKQKDAA